MKNFFAVSDEKITEKAFSQGIIVSVLSILLCVVALCSMTYAWFLGNVSSSGNTLMAGDFSGTVSASLVENGTSDSGEFLSEDTENGKWTCNLKDNETCQVTLTVSEESSSKGHCVITISKEGSSPVTVRTDPIVKQDMTDGTTSLYTFKLYNNTKSDVTVTFEVKWGVAANSDIGFGVEEPYEISKWLPSADGSAAEPTS